LKREKEFAHRMGKLERTEFDSSEAQEVSATSLENLTNGILRRG
jgi:hypothetical protein